MHIQIRLTGVSPLLMRNIRLADPLSAASRKVAEATATLTREKSESAAIEKAHAEWLGGLYYNKNLGVYIPSSWLMGSLYDGGVAYGKKGKAVRAAVIPESEAAPLIHGGPEHDLDAMWADERYRNTQAVGVGRAKVMRTRPEFPEWAVVFDADLDDALDFAVLEAIAIKAGRFSGIGDYRPNKSGTYGRYTVTVKKIVP